MAGRFRFRLEPLLRVRKRRMDAQRFAVAQAAEALRREEAVLAALRAEQARYREEVRAHRQKRAVTAQELAASRAWLNRLNRNVAETSVRVEEARSRLRAAQERLMALAREYRVVVRLRERRLAEHLRAEGKEEQRETDEIGVRSVWAGRRADHEGGAGTASA